MTGAHHLTGPAKVAKVKSIDEVLEAARGRLNRVTPEQAFEALQVSRPAGDPGAVLVDIRPAAQREQEGDVDDVVRGAVVVERNVLEWRFDPQSAARLPIASYQLQVIVLCSQGYTSSLAAAALHELGVTRATDVIGGFQAWRAAGLPTSGGRPA